MRLKKISLFHRIKKQDVIGISKTQPDVQQALQVTDEEVILMGEDESLHVG